MGKIRYDGFAKTRCCSHTSQLQSFQAKLMRLSTLSYENGLYTATLCHVGGGSVPG